jgi:hypothetical protein
MANESRSTMRKLMLGAILALALPAAAVAQGNKPSPDDLAAKACRTERSEMGAKTFKKTYAAKGMARARKACRAEHGAVAEDEIKNASRECRSERGSMGDDAFAEQYGSNHNKRNAFGKCVSGKAKAETEDETDDRVSAAGDCKAMKKDDADAFEEAYGAKKNAFGKCVSKTAKALAQDDGEDS